ncbi:NADH dehydrogenase subunit C [Geothermobacter ehrlichii]|uniref:NADH dehydrogenase subunit C n=1 Tax=Geothermobacter ehrlichii TaxID=213224 RepID=A0A5D3WJ74_9BACT|nr:NADH-quinone oxidoreductase subunit C [Geothermobacter ehrlichii]TYO98570.1 NADH dehydrogenase subunit C [Geothermobacter ehrlichii]
MSALQHRVAEKLTAAIGEGFSLSWRTDYKGVVTGWCRLPDSAQIEGAARVVAEMGGRLSTVTAYKRRDQQQGAPREIAYHFDLDGSTLTVTIELAEERPQVPSITPIFRNADWNERELMELYDIEVIGHPNPRRLFLDESIEQGVMDKLIPFSTMTNGAGSKTLWERVMAAAAGKEEK